MSEWQPIKTAPSDGNFYLYGLRVDGRRGGSWFEAYYLRRDDDGELFESSDDQFSTWSYDDFEVWALAPQPQC
jgi:hypothetical protein